MAYEINSTWTKMRQKDIEKLNKIIDNRYRIEEEIARKLSLMQKLEEAFEKGMRDFNVDVVVSYMQSVGWEWVHYEGGRQTFKVPTREEVLKRIRTDFFEIGLYRIIELGKDRYASMSGGIVADMGIYEGNAYVDIYFDIAHFVK